MENVRRFVRKSVSNKILIVAHFGRIYSKITIYIFEKLVVRKYRNDVYGLEIFGGRHWVGGPEGVNILESDADIFALGKTRFYSFRNVISGYTTAIESAGGDLKIDDAFVCDGKEDLERELPAIIARCCDVSEEDTGPICKDIVKKLLLV